MPPLLRLPIPMSGGLQTAVFFPVWATPTAQRAAQHAASNAQNKYFILRQQHRRAACDSWLASSRQIPNMTPFLDSNIIRCSPAQQVLYAQLSAAHWTCQHTPAGSRVGFRVLQLLEVALDLASCADTPMANVAPTQTQPQHTVPHTQQACMQPTSTFPAPGPSPFMGRTKRACHTPRRHIQAQRRQGPQHSAAAAAAASSSSSSSRFGAQEAEVWSFLPLGSPHGPSPKEHTHGMHAEVTHSKPGAHSQNAATQQKKL